MTYFSHIKTNRTSEKGFTLIETLLSLVVLSIAFLIVFSLFQASLHYSRGVESQVMANAIARAGIEDARVKMEKDQDFPPPGDDDQKIFSYCEIFYDLDGEKTLGSYSVTIDSTMACAPYNIVKIISIGFSGPLDAPLAKKSITAELDISAKLRDKPTANNPNYYHFINWQESGSL